MTSKSSVSYREIARLDSKDYSKEEPMYHFREMAEFATALDMKMAVVQVQRGESNQDAWNRHLKSHPHDANAMIKVFNQPGRKTARQQQWPS
jgi:hypothetical protein